MGTVSLKVSIMKRVFLYLMLLSVLLSVEAACGAQALSNPLYAPDIITAHTSRKKVDKKHFVSQIAAITHDMNEKGIAHQAIPKKTKDVLRIATYNVHGWRSPLKKFSDPIGADFQAIYNTIQKVNADVLILQEVVFRSQQTADVLSQLGYVYQSFCYGNPEGGDFGNMIVSKVPFARDPIRHNFGSTSKPHNRCYIKVEFDLRKYGVRNLIIYGTHLDVGSRKKRLAEVQELASLVHEHDAGKNVLIGADWNAVKGESSLKYLAKHGFVDSFDFVYLPQPQFTHWSGQTIDRLYLWNWHLPIAGCYVYYSAASDHLPVIMDISVNKKALFASHVTGKHAKKKKK